VQGDAIAHLRAVISAERFRGYERLGGEAVDALARYAWNSQLGASLYSTLLHVEVALRNRLHDAIATRYPTGPWRQVDCWLGRIPPFLAPSEMAQVQAAIDRVRRGGKAIVPGRVVAALTFGFWTTLLDVRYERHQILWPPLLEAAFPISDRPIEHAASSPGDSTCSDGFGIACFTTSPSGIGAICPSSTRCCSKPSAGSAPSYCALRGQPTDSLLFTDKAGRFTDLKPPARQSRYFVRTIRIRTL